MCYKTCETFADKKMMGSRGTQYHKSDRWNEMATKLTLRKSGKLCPALIDQAGVSRNFKRSPYNFASVDFGKTPPIQRDTALRVAAESGHNVGGRLLIRHGAGPFRWNRAGDATKMDERGNSILTILRAGKADEGDKKDSGTLCSARSQRFQVNGLGNRS